MNRYMKLVIPGLVIVALLLAVRTFVWHGTFPLGESAKPLQYSQFKEKLAQGKIIESGVFKKDTFEGKYSPNAPGTTGDNLKFTVTLPSSEQERANLFSLLESKKVSYEIASSGSSDLVLQLLMNVVPIVFVVILVYVFIMRQAQGNGNQALNFGRSKARRLNDNVPKVTFEDVAGVDEAKQDLQEIVEFLRNAKKFQALGAKIPKGVLLLGPPGTGKTLLARAIAGEAGVPFFHISGSDFVEMFVGVGASRVRDLFDTAKTNRPALIFIDEIDAVGRQRGAGWGGGHDEREQTLNQLLVEMDGFDPNAGVILIAATNRPDVLDPALLRPGRFDRRVVVDAPDYPGRKAILGVHTRGKPLSEDVNLENLARRTPGFTGADIGNLVNEAALLAARREKTRIEMNDFNDSIDRIVMGPERRSRVMNEQERKVTAYHEVGHAMVGELLSSSRPVHKITIVPRGMAMGMVMSMPTEDRFMRSRQEFLEDIASALGGRVAEEIVFNDSTTGAASDLDHATSIARAMVTEYGMSKRLGTLKIGNRHGSPFLGRDMHEDRNYSEEVASAVDQEVRAIIDECYNMAFAILTENRDLLERMVSAVLEKETLDRDEFLYYLEGAKMPAGLKQSTRDMGRTDQSRTAEPPTAETNGEGASQAKRPLSLPRLEPGMA